MADLDAIECWQDLALGCSIEKPGNSCDFQTGDWRTGQKPVTDKEKCIKCGLCYILCPDAAYAPADEEGYYDWLDFYCKGCGICAAECPKDAITMIEEEAS